MGCVVNQKMIKYIVVECDLKADKIAKAMGISVKSVHNKLNEPTGRLWKASEIAVLSDLTMTDAGRFYAQNSA